MSAWLPIESAPKDGSLVILNLRRNGGLVRFGHWSKWKKAWLVGFATHYKATESEPPTHWQPLPEPPK